MGRWLGLVMFALVACWGDDAYIVEGVVVEVTTPTEVLLDHKAIDGFMGAMVMPFRLRNAAVAPEDLRPGDQVVGRLSVKPGQGGPVIEKLRRTGRGPAPEQTTGGIAPIKPGQLMPRTEVPVTGGGSWVIGEGQSKPTAVAFLYTTCPLPEYCPMVVTRLQGLQKAVGDRAQILAVTIDPEADSIDVLSRYADTVGANGETWRFGRLDKAALDDLTARAALSRMKEGGEIQHALRLLVLDAKGRLVERYDDNRWPEARVVTQLTTGAPPAPPNTSGTVTAP